MVTRKRALLVPKMFLFVGALIVILMLIFGDHGTLPLKSKEPLDLPANTPTAPVALSIGGNL